MPMKTVTVNLGERSYRIHVGRGLISRVGDELCSLMPPCKTALVTDENVEALYCDALERSLRGAGFEPKRIVLRSGERSKSLATARRLYDEFLGHRLDRKSLVVALGGGVVGDVAGFAAATYMRGIAFVQVPTTLLAQVDSSVGGKVAVNHPLGKNLIGAFHQPIAVFIDVRTLKTLPEREYKSGLAELVKHGLIRDARFFALLEKNVKALKGCKLSFLEQAVAKSVAIKARVVEADERESGLRAILNYGHTIGHAIEAVSRYRGYTHGEAVAIGMACAARIAMNRGMLKEDAVVRQNDLLARIGLPVALRREPTEALIASLYRDKKTIRGRLRFVLLERIGKATIVEGISEEEVVRAIEECRADS